jgi:hypothetical protein
MVRDKISPERRARPEALEGLAGATGLSPTRTSEVLLRSLRTSGLLYLRRPVGVVVALVVTVVVLAISAFAALAVALVQAAVAHLLVPRLPLAEDHDLECSMLSPPPPRGVKGVTCETQEEASLPLLLMVVVVLLLVLSLGSVPRLLLLPPPPLHPRVLSYLLLCIRSCIAC